MKKLIAFILICLVQCSIVNAQIKYSNANKNLIGSATTATPTLIDNSATYILTEVKEKINCTFESIGAMAQYNVGIFWSKDIGVKNLMVCNNNNQFYNENTDPATTKIFIYTPSSAITNMQMNKGVSFSLKDFNENSAQKKGMFQIQVYGFEYKSTLKQIWTAAFIFLFKFSNGKNTIYKYLKIPSKTYTIASQDFINVSFGKDNLITGTQNFPADPALVVPQIH